MANDEGGPIGAHWIQVRRAFGGDPERPAELAEVVSGEGGALVVRSLASGARRRFVVADPVRLAATLARADLCRTEGGGALAVVNASYRVLAIAFGVATPPRRLAIPARVCRLEDGYAVEIPSLAPEQPSFCVLVATEDGGG